MKSYYELAQEVKNLKVEDRLLLFREILSDDKVSVNEILVSRIALLEEYKQNAQRDIVRVATAGIELGEKEMRRITIKGKTRHKSDDFQLGMVKCLLDAGAYKDSSYGDEMRKADFSNIDKVWYESAWKPLTLKMHEDNLAEEK